MVGEGVDGCVPFFDKLLLKMQWVTPKFGAIVLLFTFW